MGKLQRPTTIAAASSQKWQQQQTKVNGSNDDNKDNDPNFDRKLDIITLGAKPYVKEHLLTKISRENCKILINYIMAMQSGLVLLGNTELILS